MRKILLLAIIALSVNAIAQNPQISRIKILKQIETFKKNALTVPIQRTTQKISSPKQLVDSSYSYRWDKNMNSWSLTVNYDGKWKYQYDVKGNKTSSIRKYFEYSTFMNRVYNYVDEINYSYDDNNNLTSEIVKQNDAQVTRMYTESERTWTYDLKNNLTSCTFILKDHPIAIIDLDFEYYKKHFNKQDLYTFNANSIQTCYIHRDWITDWVNTSKDSTILNADSRLIGKLVQEWDSASKAWVNIKNESTTYSINGNDSIAITLGQFWKGGVWADSTKTTINEILNGKIIEQTTISQTMENGIWINKSKTFMVADFTDMTAPKIMSMAMYQWDGSAWVGFIRYNNITFRDGFEGMFTYVAEMWTGTAWISVMERKLDGNIATEIGFSSKTITNYDTNFNPTSEIFQSSISSKWVNDSIKTAGYDSNNFIKYKTIKEYKNDTISYSDSTVNYYRTMVAGVKSLKLLNSNITVYPNPTTSHIQIKGIEGKANLNVFGIDGKLLLIKAFTDNETISVSTLPKGIYLLKFSTKDGVIEKKLVKN
jgi:hypothetical protein